MAKQKQTPKANPQPRPIAQAKPPVQAATPDARGNAPAAKWLMIVLAVVAFLVNVRTINYDYTLDDPFFTKENPNVSRGLAAIPEFFTHAAYYGVFANHDASYRPFMLTSFAAEKDLFGFDPHTGHLINLLLFTLEIVVLFLMLRRIFKDLSVYIPFFITLLFALHPIHTEVVASIKSRDELMGLLFSALCLLQSMRYIDTGKMLNLIFSGVWFFCALMSKETPIAMVAIVPLTIYFFRDVPMKKIITTMLPYVTVAIVYMIMRSMFIESDGKKVVILVNNNALMAATNYGEKLGTLLYIQLKYIILLVVPHPLSYDYSFNQIPIIGLGNPKALLAILVIGGMLAYAVIGLKRKDVFAYCIWFYAMSTIITSNLLVDIGATMAERFVYTASLGFCIAVVFGIAKLLKADMRTAGPATARPLFIGIVVIAVLYAGKTMARNEVWQNNEELYRSGLETAPDSWRAQYLLGVEYTRKIGKEQDPAVKKQLYEDAVQGFNKSLQILPNNSDVYLIKGYAEEFAGKDDSAIAAYRNTVRIDSNNKLGLNNLGAMYLRHSMLDEAIAILTRAIAKDSTYTEAIANLAASYGNKGMFKEAEMYYLRALRINPDQPANVFRSMSNIYHFMGDSVNAPKYRQLTAQAEAKGNRELVK